MPTVKKQSVKKPITKPKLKKGLLSRVEDINFDDEGLKINLYGRSSTGKTTLWSSFPKPILAVICSGGKKAGELRSVSNVKGIKTIDVQKHLGTTEAIPELCQEIEEGGSYKTVVLDHATHLQDMRLKEILGLDILPSQKSWGLASQQQYGQCAANMKDYLRSFLDLTANVVIVAQEREFNTEQEGDSLLLPYVASALTPSVVGWLNPACDYIMETFIRQRTIEKSQKVGGKLIKRSVTTNETEYCLRTAPNAVYTTKFRLPKGHKLPDVIVDPDYNKIMQVINGTT